MNKHNLVRLFMMESVSSLAHDNQQITDLVLAFKNGIVSLDAIIAEINGLSGQQSQSVLGGGEQKELARTALNFITFNTIKATRGWANSQNNANLSSELNYSKTKVARISDKNIVQRAEYWLGLVNEHIDDLASWNITPETITQWEAAIAGYQAVLQLPKSKRELKKNKTAQLNTLIKQGMNFCRNILDSAAIGFKTNGNMEFYNMYISYRRIDQVASKIGKFRVLITDELNQPIANVEIKQDGKSNSTTTDIHGHASLNIMYNKNVPKEQLNLYSFTLTHGENMINTGLMAIKRNETISRKYTMAPTGFIIPAYHPAPVLVDAQ